MRGLESFENTGHTTHETPRVSREDVLKAIADLHKNKSAEEFSNLNDPEVSKVSELFNEWAESLPKNVEDPEAILMSNLEQNMIMFDAGIVNGEEGLLALKDDLSKISEQIKDDNFIELEEKISDYNKKIEAKLKSSKR